jgi:hypothetical protein
VTDSAVIFRHSSVRSFVNTEINCPVVRSATGKSSFKTTYSFSYESFADASGINSTTKEKMAVNICSMVSFHTYRFKGFYFPERTIKVAD